MQVSRLAHGDLKGWINCVGGYVAQAAYRTRASTVDAD